MFTRTRAVAMRRSHAGFDLALEALTCLSPHPVRRVVLAGDLGVGKPELAELLDQLRDRGFMVRQGLAITAELNAARRRGRELGPGVYLWVAREGWPAARVAAQHYWNRVYAKGEGASGGTEHDRAADQREVPADHGHGGGVESGAGPGP